MRTIELKFEEEQNFFMREAFNTLRTNILFSGKNIKTIVFTSCLASEGKTTVTYEIARNLAESGKKVLVIDADLRKSVMATRYTKERGIVGLSQVLSGQIDADSAIYKTQSENLDIIFAGPYPPNPTELVGSPAFKELLDLKRNDYDYLLIDAAPLGLVIDAAVMASVCDGAVIVLTAGRIKYRMAQDVKEQLERSGCNILGVVLNQVGRKNASSYGGYYGGKYGSYYGNESSSNTQKAQAPSAVRRPAQAPTASAQTVARPMPPRPTPSADRANTVRRPVQTDKKDI